MSRHGMTRVKSIEQQGISLEKMSFRKEYVKDVKGLLGSYYTAYLQFKKYQSILLAVEIPIAVAQKVELERQAAEVLKTEQELAQLFKLNRKDRSYIFAQPSNFDLGSLFKNLSEEECLSLTLSLQSAVHQLEAFSELVADRFKEAQEFIVQLQAKVDTVNQKINNLISYGCNVNIIERLKSHAENAQIYIDGLSLKLTSEQPVDLKSLPLIEFISEEDSKQFNQFATDLETTNRVADSSLNLFYGEIQWLLLNAPLLFSAQQTIRGEKLRAEYHGLVLLVKNLCKQFIEIAKDIELSKDLLLQLQEIKIGFEQEGESLTVIQPADLKSIRQQIVFARNHYNLLTLNIPLDALVHQRMRDKAAKDISNDLYPKLTVLSKQLDANDNNFSQLPAVAQVNVELNKFSEELSKTQTSTVVKASDNGQNYQAWMTAAARVDLNACSIEQLNSIITQTEKALKTVTLATKAVRKQQKIQAKPINNQKSIGQIILGTVQNGFEYVIRYLWTGVNKLLGEKPTKPSILVSNSTYEPNLIGSNLYGHEKLFVEKIQKQVEYQDKVDESSLQTAERTTVSLLQPVFDSKEQPVVEQTPSLRML